MQLKASTYTRLTEIYRSIQPSSKSEFWPFADELGREFILYSANDGALCYYVEDDGHGYEIKSLGISGTITSMASSPYLGPSGCKGSACICVDTDTGGTQFVVLRIVGKTLKHHIVPQMDKYNCVKVGGGPLMGQTCASLVYRNIYGGEKGRRCLNWYMTEKNEKELVFDMDSGYSVGPAMLHPQRWKLPGVLMFRSDTVSIEGKTCLRSTFMSEGVGTGNYPIPDDMKPCTLIQAELAELEGGADRLLLLIERNKKRELWIADADNGKIENFRPMQTSDTMELRSFSVQPVRRNFTLEMSVIATAFNRPGQLYHAFCKKDHEGEVEFIPIINDADSYHACVNQQGEDLFYYVKKNGSERLLYRMCYCAKEDAWLEELVTPRGGTAYRAVSVYESGLTLTDSAGKPVQYANVRVMANSHMLVESGGEFFQLSKVAGKMLKTDVAGRLTLFHETHELSDPDILLEISSGGTVLKETISPAEMQRRRLSGLERKAMENARDSEGAFILSPERRKDTETLDNVCTAVRDLAKSNSADRLFASGTEAFCLEKLKDGSVLRRELSALQAESMSRDMLGGDMSFWSDVADFFKSIAKGIVDIIKTIFEKIGQAIKATINFIIDGVKHVIQFIVGVVQQVINTIESVLSLVLKAFDPLFNWLGELLGVNSILRTQAAVKFVIGQVPTALSRKAEEGLEWMKKGLAWAGDKLDEYIGLACATLGDATPNGKKSKTESSIDPFRSASGNYVSDMLLREAVKCPLPADFALELETPAQELLELLKSISENAKKDPAYNEAVNYLTQTAGGGRFMDNPLTSFLMGLKSLMRLTLSLISSACEKLIRLGLKCLDALQTLMGKKLPFPLLSALFKGVFKQDLTFLNVASLLIAMPMHGLMKLIAGRVPFENDAEEKRFESECRKLMSSSAAPVRSEVNEGCFMVLSCICGGCQIFAYLFTAVSDGMGTKKARGDDTATAADVADFLGVIANLCWVIAAVPALEREKDEDDFTYACRIVMWVVCVVNVLIDYVIFEASTPEKNLSTVGLVLGEITGVVYAVFDIIYWARACIQKETGMAFASEMVICLQSVGRFLLLIKGTVVTAVIEIVLDSLASLMGLGNIVYPICAYYNKPVPKEEMLYA